jgi:protein-disulfide isomerase
MPSRQEIRERRRKQKQRQRLTIVLVTAGTALILAAILMVPNIVEALAPVGDFVIPESYTRPLANANAMGDPNAPVVMEEYSDFACSHCATFSQTVEKQIVDQYVATGQVYFVYHSVGSMMGYPSSTVATEAAYCAGDQNKFWEYQDIVFVNQISLFSNINRKLDKALAAYAEALGMDMEAFNSCFTSNKYASQIEQDLESARQAGINSTPSFVINGTMMLNTSFGGFQSAIDAELAKTGQQ